MRCSCSGSTCRCQLVAGPGVTITGTGSATDPFTIDQTPITGALKFTNTPTIAWTVSGAGVPGNPYTISAAATIKLLTGMKDFVGAPAVAGDIIVTNGDGTWSLVAPPPSPPGTVNIGKGLTGTGAAATPVKVGTTDGVSSSDLGGDVVYVDSAGKLRTYPYRGRVYQGLLASVQAWSPPVGVRAVRMRMVGGGGGGGNALATTATQASAGGGGAAGSYGEFWVVGSAIPATFQVSPAPPGTAAAAGAVTSVTGGGMSWYVPGGAAGSTMSSPHTPVDASDTVWVAGGARATVPADPGPANWVVLGSEGEHGQVTGTRAIGGAGGKSMYGSWTPPYSALNGGGRSARRYGSGGSGAWASGSSSAQTGGVGAGGCVLVEAWI